MARKVLLLTALVLVTVVASAAWRFRTDMRRSYARVRGAVTRTIPSPFGDLEYAEGGAGQPVLVVHGAGGGFDQGELIARAVLTDGFRWIAPSRFGYLGSSLPHGATWDDQADAYAYLLDHLELDRVAVVAMSQGGPSALLFAARYPDRVSSLTCLSCGVAPSDSDDQAEANSRGNMLRTVFKHDVLYWIMSTAFERQLTELIGANGTVIESLTPEQREIVGSIIAYMNPAEPRYPGVVFDNETPLPGERISAITAPTLIVHAEDDMLQLYRNGQFAASNIPGASLMSFARGGHVVLAVEQDVIRAAVTEHIRAHADIGTSPAL